MRIQVSNTRSPYDLLLVPTVSHSTFYSSHSAFRSDIFQAFVLYFSIVHAKIGFEDILCSQSHNSNIKRKVTVSRVLTFLPYKKMEQSKILDLQVRVKNKIAALVNSAKRLKWKAWSSAWNVSKGYTNTALKKSRKKSSCCHSCYRVAKNFRVFSFFL